MSTEHRLHPVSFLFLAWSQARALVVPALALLVASSSVQRWERIGTLLGLMALVPALLHALIRQITTRYRLADEELVIRRGLVSRTRRHIPYARIHNISVRQTPVHRLLGVADAQVETAGGPDPDAELQVLSLGAIDDMKAQVFAHRGDQVTAVPPEEGAASLTRDGGDGRAAPAPRTLVALTLGDVLAYGLIQNRGWLVVSALLGMAWQMGWMDTEAMAGRDRFADVFTRLVMGAYTRDLTSMVQPLAIIVGLVVLGLVIVRVLSLGWAISSLHGFTLSRRGDELMITRGLFTRVSMALPIHRLQMIAIHETPLHRLFGRAEVAVLTVTPVLGQEARASAPRWLAPVLPAGAVPRLLAEVMPDAAALQAAWQPASPLTRTRLVRKRVRLFVALTALLTAAIGLAGLALAATVPLAWPLARRQARAFGVACTPTLVAGRSGWLWRSERYVPIDRVQTLSLTASPFDRRYGMASVLVDTAGHGEALGILDLPYLGAPDASELLRTLEARL